MITEKLIDFGIMAKSKPQREAPAKADYISEHTSALEESIFHLNGMLMNVKRTQKWCIRIYSPLAHILIHLSYIFHTRNNRGFSIVWSTQKYAFIWHNHLHLSMFSESAQNPRSHLQLAERASLMQISL